MKASKIFLVLCFACNIVYANDSLESYISADKIMNFDYDYQQNRANSSKLRDSWISPIKLQYSYTKSNAYDTVKTTENKSITINQPIFSSGGIYYGIKYAQASLKYSNYSVETIKQKLIKDAISLLMQIKKTDLNLKKQKLLMKNANINLKIKKDLYLNGQLDSGFLDQAIIDRNSVIELFYDIETSKQRLISSFKAISDIEYKTAFIPKLKFLKKDVFLKHNLFLNMYKSKSLKDDYNKHITIAKYLPHINLTAGYNFNTTNEQDLNYYNYGFRVDIPLDINTFRDIESSKLSYLKSKINIRDQERTLTSLYEQVSQNIENFDKKQSLSVENKAIYTKLLDDTKKLYKAGYKTKYDVEMLQNSLIIQDIDIKMLNIDKQLELLNLYESYKG